MTQIKVEIKSFIKSPALILIFMQLAAFLFVYSKGAGAIYADMILFLLGITLLTWYLTKLAGGNEKILVYTLLLLTIGTMLQCTFKAENLAVHPELADSHPAFSLQIQYGIALVAASACGILYRKCPQISSLKVCKILMMLSVLISGLTLVLAKSVGNVRNWIVIGGFSIQTTEIIKLFYVLIAAALLGSKEEVSKRRQIAFLGITFLDILFLAIQSEFGTMLLLLIIFLMYVFLFIGDIRVFLVTVIFLTAGIGLIVVTGGLLTNLREQGNTLANNPVIVFFLHNYDKIANRFIFWIDPAKDPQGLGYQLIQAKNSILLGGWFGSSSVTDLPVKTSDLVYPALIQRCGMVFGVMVFIIFILSWLEGILLFVRKKDRYHCALAAGIVFMLLIQALIIIGGSTGLCPLTGITLPFISSGGSSLMVSSIMVGLLISISGDVSWEGINEDENEFFKESEMFAKWCSHLRHSYAGGISESIRHRSWHQSRGRSKEIQSKTGFLSKRIYKGKHSGQKWSYSGKV